MSETTGKQQGTIVSREMTTDSGYSQTIPCGDSKTGAESTIRLVKDGDRVHGINVHCGCGQTIQVICEYE